MTFDPDYQSGQIAFERGEYRQAVSYFLAAVAQVQPHTQLGGEVQVWLVTAFEAAGQLPEAKALCQQLANHPHLDTRQASKRMLYIMQAPDLVRKNVGINTRSISPPPPKQPSLEERYAPIDLTQVNTKDNNFIAIALLLTLVTLGGLWLLARG
jgi:hypothetical protein